MTGFNNCVCVILEAKRVLIKKLFISNIYCSKALYLHLSVLNNFSILKLFWLKEINC